MLNVSKHIGEGFGKGELYDTLIALQLESGLLPISGKTYFVCQRGNGTTGLSWENAFTTIVAAITASNVDIIKTENVGRRNRIYIDGGNYTETISQLPFRSDMIGVGGQPSRVFGDTYITTSPTGFGNCHIYNMVFINTTGVPNFRIAGNWNRVEWQNCFFQGSATRATVGLQIGSGVQYFKVNNCKFVGNPPTTTGIQIDGASNNMFEITNNFINAVTTGILSSTGNLYGSLIKNNVIGDGFGGATGIVRLVTGINILGDSKIMIVNNFISAVDAIRFENAAAYTTSLTINNQVLEGADGSIVALRETAYA